MELDEQELCYDDGDCHCRGQLVVPRGAAGSSAVLLAPSGGGLTGHAIAQARQVAALGHVVLAADFYGERRLCTGLGEAERALAPFMADDGLVRRRIGAGFAALCSQPQVDPGRIGALGYCFGGKAVLELARSGAALRATVAFHGLLGTRNPADARRIRGSVLVCAGAEDVLVPPGELAAFAEEMRAADIDWQLHLHGGARHAFTNPHVGDEGGRFGYHRLAAERSWAAMAALFGSALAPR